MKEPKSLKAIVEVSFTVLVLQGLTVCGHCHYAYYGKRISPSAAKGQHQYAYYRCIGTDAYRLGDQKICDNTQVRTATPDVLVWVEVINALENPARMKNEYERRLSVLLTRAASD